MRPRSPAPPSGAAAALVGARRVRAALRGLADVGPAGTVPGTATGAALRARAEALSEINRVLGRSAGVRRVERGADDTYARTFATVGDAFAGLLVPVVDSAPDTLVAGTTSRVRSCANPRCGRAPPSAARGQALERPPAADQAGVGASFR